MTAGRIGQEGDQDDQPPLFEEPPMFTIHGLVASPLAACAIVHLRLIVRGLPLTFPTTKHQAATVESFVSYNLLFSGVNMKADLHTSS